MMQADILIKLENGNEIVIFGTVLSGKEFINGGERQIIKFESQWLRWGEDVAIVFNEDEK